MDQIQFNFLNYNFKLVKKN